MMRKPSPILCLLCLLWTSMLVGQTSDEWSESEEEIVTFTKAVNPPISKAKYGWYFGLSGVRSQMESPMADTRDRWGAGLSLGLTGDFPLTKRYAFHTGFDLQAMQIRQNVNNQQLFGADAGVVRVSAGLIQYGIPFHLRLVPEDGIGPYVSFGGRLMGNLGVNTRANLVTGPNAEERSVSAREVDLVQGPIFALETAIGGQWFAHSNMRLIFSDLLFGVTLSEVIRRPEPAINAPRDYFGTASMFYVTWRVGGFFGR